jgi:hypothetical protein
MCTIIVAMCKKRRERRQARDKNGYGSIKNGWIWMLCFENHREIIMGYGLLKKYLFLTVRISLSLRRIFLVWVLGL